MMQHVTFILRLRPLVIMPVVVVELEFTVLNIFFEFDFFDFFFTFLIALLLPRFSTLSYSQTKTKTIQVIKNLALVLMSYIYESEPNHNIVYSNIFSHKCFGLFLPFVLQDLLNSLHRTDCQALAHSSHNFILYAYWQMRFI